MIVLIPMYATFVTVNVNFTVKRSKHYDDEKTFHDVEITSSIHNVHFILRFEKYIIIRVNNLNVTKLCLPS